MSTSCMNLSTDLNLLGIGAILRSRLMGSRVLGKSLAIVINGNMTSCKKKPRYAKTIICMLVFESLLAANVADHFVHSFVDYSPL